MDLSIILYVIAGVMAIIFGYLYFDINIGKNKKGAVKILLFEKIGDSEAFVDIFSGEEVSDEKLGLFILIKKRKIPVEMPNFDCFFPHKGAKAIMVVKYDDDDYRVMHKMRDKRFYRREQVPDLVESKVKDADGEEFIDMLPRRDAKGNIVFKDKEVAYNDPLGISQQDREVSRFRRDYYLRMEELRKTKQGFFDKYGAMLLNFSLALMFIIAMLYTYNKSIERDKYWADKFDEKALEYLNIVKEPGWIDGLIDKIETRNVVEDTPPVLK